MGADGLTTVSPLKPVIVMSFFSAFGGTGLILEKLKFNPVITIVLSISSGLLIAYLFYKFIIIPLYKHRTLTKPKSECIGSEGIVIDKIMENGFGKISYKLGGSIVTSPARSLDEKEIKQNKIVVIQQLKDNVCYVKTKGEIE